MTSCLLYLHAVCVEDMNKIVNRQKLPAHTRPIVIYCEEITTELHTVVVILNFIVQFFILIVLK